MARPSSPRVAVVGAGIIGLSSAYLIKKTFPNAQVIVIADTFSPSLTTNVAAGLIQPYLIAEDPIVEQACRETFPFIASLVGAGAGALWQSGFSFSLEARERPFWADVVKGFRQATAEEMARQPLPYKSGWFFTTLALETTIFMDYLMTRYKALGGKVLKWKVSSLDELKDDYDMIVNGSGLGARALVGDTGLRPVRGQVIRVRAPSVKHFFADDDFYVLLNRDVVILGGTHDENEWDTTPSMAVAQRILTECTRRAPELKEAEIVTHAVGLRPCRERLRLDEEKMKRRDGAETLIVHNYGHGGSGITLFWGCAREVTRRIQAHLAAQQPKAHL